MWRGSLGPAVILLTRALASHALKMQNPAPDDAVVIRPAEKKMA